MPTHSIQPSSMPTWTPEKVTTILSQVRLSFLSFPSFPFPFLPFSIIFVSSNLWFFSSCLFFSLPWVLSNMIVQFTPTLSFLTPSFSPSTPIFSQDFYFMGVPANFSEYDLQYWQFVNASTYIVKTALGLGPMDTYTFNRYVLTTHLPHTCTFSYLPLLTCTKPYLHPYLHH